MRLASALAACGLLAGCVTAPASPPPEPIRGYLDAASIDAIAGGFPPPPPSPSVWPGGALGLPGGDADRWWLATAHAELRPPEAAQHFDCVLGTRLTEKPRPALTRLMGRLLSDSNAVTRRMAEANPRRRPIALNPELQPCQRVDAATRDSPSWPASGAVVGTAYGEMFAELAPDLADAARARGYDIGHSREVCRMNWSNDVHDGFRAGRRVYASATLASDFTADLEAARAEVAAARAEGLTNPSCAAERRTLREPTIRPDAA